MGCLLIFGAYQALDRKWITAFCTCKPFQPILVLEGRTLVPCTEGFYELGLSVGSARCEISKRIPLCVLGPVGGLIEAADGDSVRMPPGNYKV